MLQLGCDIDIGHHEHGVKFNQWRIDFVERAFFHEGIDEALVKVSFKGDFKEAASIFSRVDKNGAPRRPALSHAGGRAEFTRARPASPPSPWQTTRRRRRARRRR